MKASIARTKGAHIVTSFRRCVEDTVKVRRPAKAARANRRRANREIYFQLMECAV